MALDLNKVKKGETVGLDFTKRSDGRILAFVGLGWDTPEELGEVDLDASVIMLGANGKPRTPKDLYFYKHLFDGHIPDENEEDKELWKKSPIAHTGDARDSAGDDNGDEEVVLIDFSKIPDDIEKLAVVVSVFDEEEKKGTKFGQVTNAYVRVCTTSDEEQWLKGEGTEKLIYDLTEDASTSTAMLFCEIVRNGSKWDFNAIGEPIGNGSGFNGLIPIAKKYGLS